MGKGVRGGLWRRGRAEEGGLWGRGRVGGEGSGGGGGRAVGEWEGGLWGRGRAVREERKESKPRGRSSVRAVSDQEENKTPALV